MSTIDSMLSSEKILLERKIERLESECESRPRGTIVSKARGRLLYAYLVRRETGKVVTEYLGRSDSWKIRGIDAKIKERKRYEAELKSVKAEYARVLKMIKASGHF